jgi:hypothetical protein
MLKSALRVFIILLAALLLTACLEHSMTIKLQRNGSADISFQMGMDKSLFPLTDKADTTDDVITQTTKIALRDSFTVRGYENVKYRGVIATRHVKNLAELEKLVLFRAGVWQQQPVITKRHTLFRTYYYLDYIPRFPDVNRNSLASVVELIHSGKLDSTFFFVHNWILPGKIIKHNANSYDTKTHRLSWKIAAENTRFHIQAEFYVLRWLPFFLLFLLAATAVIFLILHFRNQD